MALVFGVVLSAMGIATIKIVQGGAEVYNQSIEVTKSYWAAEGALRIALRYLSRTCTGVGDVVPTINQTFTITPDVSANGKVNGYTIPAFVCSTKVNGSIKTYNFSTQIPVANTNLANLIRCSGVSASTYQKMTYFVKQPITTPWSEFTVDGNVHVDGYALVSSLMDTSVHITGEFSTSDTTRNANLGEPYNRGIRLSDSASNYGSSIQQRTAWMQKRLPNKSTVGKIALDPINTNSLVGYNLPYLTNNAADYRLVLDGNMVHVWAGSRYAPIGNFWKVADLDINSIPNRTIVVDDNVIVKGTLDGQLTIVQKSTPNDGNTNNDWDMYIGDNILYADRDLDPTRSTPNDDNLALIAARNIVTFNADLNGDYYKLRREGVTVCGALMAPNGTLLFPQESSHYVDFTVYGSILVNAMTQSFTQYSDGGRQGFRVVCNKDPRVLNNLVKAPGIGGTPASDPEFTVTTYMWILDSGTWENKVLQQ